MTNGAREAMKHSTDIERGGRRELYVGRARALAPEIEASGALIEEQRRIPTALIKKLLDAGLFHMLLPRSLGGGEVDPGTFARVIVEIAKADASTAWCLCQASGCSMSAAYLDAGRRAGSLRRSPDRSWPGGPAPMRARWRWTAATG